MLVKMSGTSHRLGHPISATMSAVGMPSSAPRYQALCVRVGQGDLEIERPQMHVEMQKRSALEQGKRPFIGIGDEGKSWMLEDVQPATAKIHRRRCGLVRADLLRGDDPSSFHQVVIGA